MAGIDALRESHSKISIGLLRGKRFRFDIQSRNLMILCGIVAFVRVCLLRVLCLLFVSCFIVIAKAGADG